MHEIVATPAGIDTLGGALERWLTNEMVVREGLEPSTSAL